MNVASDLIQLKFLGGSRVIEKEILVIRRVLKPGKIVINEIEFDLSDISWQENICTNVSYGIIGFILGAIFPILSHMSSPATILGGLIGAAIGFWPQDKSVVTLQLVYKDCPCKVYARCPSRSFKVLSQYLSINGAQWVEEEK